MKKYLLLFLPLLLAQFAAANDQLRNVQTELKTQGFYYGDLNGQETSETSAALKRYQIRRGLAVTGTLNEETLNSLGMKGSVPPQPKEQPAPSVAAAPPVSRKPAPNAAESDRNFLLQEEYKRSRENAPDRYNEPPPASRRADKAESEPPPQAEPEPRLAPPESTSPAARVDPSVPPDRPEVADPEYAEFYANTPYLNLPHGVQRELVRRAQAELATRGFFHKATDGVPTPALEEAILGFQRHDRLAASGRLDIPTVTALNLLPKRGADPTQWKRTSGDKANARREVNSENTPREGATGRTYRGVQVD